MRLMVMGMMPTKGAMNSNTAQTIQKWCGVRIASIAYIVYIRSAIILFVSAMYGSLIQEKTISAPTEKGERENDYS
jgi:hypothetical protein